MQNAQSTSDNYREVEEKLNKTFTNFQAKFVKPSPISGLFEIHTTDNIIYFDPKSETMMFGRLYDKNGVDLTRQSLTLATQTRLKHEGSDIQDKLNSAVVINKGGDITLTIFTNPDCPYCVNADAWLDDIARAKGISIEKHLIFLSSTRFKTAQSKIEHVLCATDKTKAYQAINSTPLAKRLTCDSAKAILETHTQLVNFFGINGTPSFLTDDGEIISGLDKARLETVIDQLINQKTTDTTEK